MASGREIEFCAEMIKKKYGTRREIEIGRPTAGISSRTAVDLGGVMCRIDPVETDHSYGARMLVESHGHPMGRSEYEPVPERLTFMTDRVLDGVTETGALAAAFRLRFDRDPDPDELEEIGQFAAGAASP